MAIINESMAGTRLGSYGVSSTGITIAGSTKTYANYAEMLADTVPGSFAFVQDATADESVVSGFAIYYRKNGAWKKIFEEEAMDRDAADGMKINWSKIVDAPPLADVQDAIAKKHSHSNAQVLDKLGYDETKQAVTYNGIVPKANPYRYTTWLQLVCPEYDCNAIDCIVQIYDSIDMTNCIHELSTAPTAPINHLDRFKYYDIVEKKFKQVPSTGIPTGERIVNTHDTADPTDDEFCRVSPVAGRFVIVDIRDLIGSQSLYIRWIWQAREYDQHGHLAPKTILEDLTVYPAITPTNAFSVGMFWGIESAE